MGFLWPLFLIIASNVVYNITTKSTPHSVNPFLSVTITYCMGAVVSLLIYSVTSPNHHVIANIRSLNWTSYLLGLAIVGLEVGYIYLYRAGWDISVGSLVANISLAVILLVIGALFYKDQIHAKQIAGMVLCLAGLILINLK